MAEAALLRTRAPLVQAYNRKVCNGTTSVDQTGHVDGAHPEWRTVEKVFAEREAYGRKEYYVKWYMLGYGESTWEAEEDLQSDAVRAVHAACAAIPCAPLVCEQPRYAAPGSGTGACLTLQDTSRILWRHVAAPWTCRDAERFSRSSCCCGKS